MIALLQPDNNGGANGRNRALWLGSGLVRYSVFINRNVFIASTRGGRNDQRNCIHPDQCFQAIADPGSDQSEA